MGLLVRTWNVFHGNADPPRRPSYLRRMLELAVKDAPDVVCVQELPVWALGRLERWTSMWHAHSVARKPLVLPGSVAGWVTRRHQGLLRSGLSGQANAVLVARTHVAVDLGDVQISEEGRERRTCHAVRVSDRLVIANLHASNAFDTPDVMRGEIARALGFAEGHARRDDPVVLAGDFNLEHVELPGFSAPGSGIDHILCRGIECSRPTSWTTTRRTVGGVVLSDHPPVEVRLG